MEMPKVKLLFDNKELHIKKWKPILTKLTSSDKLIEMYSIFCEYSTMKSDVASFVSSPASSYGYNAPHSSSVADSLALEIRNIHAIISDLPSIRVKCIGNNLYYNKLHNRFEYLLHDNLYVGTSKETPIGGPDLNTGDILSAFPDDFVREVDMIEYRDKKLNSLV